MVSLFAISVRQPFAWAIAEGGKTVENRSWRTSFEGGLIAIHAAAKDDDPLAVPAFLTMKAQASPAATRSAIIAVVRLVGTHAAGCTPGCTPWQMCSPWAIKGMRHWVIADPRPLAEPVPCRGNLGLWRLPEDVEKAVRAQLEVDRVPSD